MSSLLQINSEDVANSTHDRCVQLIKSAGENLILKVTKPVGHVGTVLQTSPSVPGDVSFPVTVLFLFYFLFIVLMFLMYLE